MRLIVALDAVSLTIALASLIAPLAKVSPLAHASAIKIAVAVGADWVCTLATILWDDCAAKGAVPLVEQIAVAAPCKNRSVGIARVGTGIVAHAGLGAVLPEIPRGAISPAHRTSAHSISS